MENEKEKKYFIIWLYISILLHLFVVIIMLSIKPTISPSKDPDPASNSYDETQVIFLQDQPVAALPTQDEPQVDEPQQPEHKIATRVQGGDIALQQNPADPKDAQRDIPAPALSDEYKKGMQNQTKVEDQGLDGHVNILEDATIDYEEQREKQIMPPTPQAIQPAVQEQLQEELPITINNDLKTYIPSPQEKRIASAEILKAIIQEKMQKASDTQTEKNYEKADEASEKFKPTEELPQLQPQKIVSKKHRPADFGLENISKVQLSKETQDNAPVKKKVSLQDIQQGFSQFIRTGNEEYYSGQGNAQHDDAEGLKRASYYRQLGQMYKNAHAIAPNLLHGTQFDTPINNSIILITIERSGRISNSKSVTNCGVDALDRHHMRVIESIGSFPPIPKYIEAPLQITATLYFRSDQSFSSSFTPSRIRH